MIESWKRAASAERGAPWRTTVAPTAMDRYGVGAAGVSPVQCQNTGETPVAPDISTRCSGLQPGDFQVVFDLLDAVDPAKNFLRHLFVVIRADRAAEHHASLLGLEAQIARLEVGAL